MTFSDRLLDAIDAKGTPCIIGLDPNLSLFPQEFLRERGLQPNSPRRAFAEAIFEYNRMVLDVVHDLVPAVKPQSAYYERYGSDGVLALERTIAHARDLGLLVILDAKRGDIGATSQAYADAYLGPDPTSPTHVDAITLNPYLGRDSLEPFFNAAAQNHKGVFVCVKNSNPGAQAFQTQDAGGVPVYERVASFVEEAHERALGERGYSAIGAVVGANSLAEARRLRSLLPRTLFLVPGLGAQGGSIDVVRACFGADAYGAIVSASRSILFPHRYGDEAGPHPARIRRAVHALRTQVAQCLA